jgi:hypothetical protein
MSDDKKRSVEVESEGQGCSAMDLVIRATKRGATRTLLAKAACVCARAVLGKVDEKDRGVCLNAIEAAEAWAAEPTEANKELAYKASRAVYPVTVGCNASWAANAAYCAANVTHDTYHYRAATAAASAFSVDKSIDFQTLIMAALPEITAYLL